MLTIETTDRNREDISDMGREQMRNLEISKIGATQVNEFEYQKHQGEMTEQDHPHEQGGKTKRLTQAERVAQVTAAAHKKVERSARRKRSQVVKERGRRRKEGPLRIDEAIARQFARYDVCCVRDSAAHQLRCNFGCGAIRAAPRKFPSAEKVVESYLKTIGGKKRVATIRDATYEWRIQLKDQMMGLAKTQTKTPSSVRTVRVSETVS